jgi:hypothetical protein
VQQIDRETRIAGPERVAPPAEGGASSATEGGGNPAPEGGDEAAIELAFWDTVKDSEIPADFIAYLERFPTGNFAALARTRLIGLTAAAEAEGDEEVKLEIAYWESVKDSDDPAMFRAYLGRYAEGNFKELAEARLDQLEADGATKRKPRRKPAARRKPARKARR